MERTCKHRIRAGMNSDAPARSQWSCQRGGTVTPTHPCSVAGKGHPTHPKGRMSPSHGINTETRLRQGLLLTTVVSATLLTQLLPRCGQDGGTQALALAPPRALCPVNTTLFAQQINLSAVLCPSYSGKHELSQRQPTPSPCCALPRVPSGSRGVRPVSPEASEGWRKPQLCQCFPSRLAWDLTAGKMSYRLATRSHPAFLAALSLTMPAVPAGLSASSPAAPKLTDGLILTAGPSTATLLYLQQ